MNVGGACFSPPDKADCVFEAGYVGGRHFHVIESVGDVLDREATGTRSYDSRKVKK